MLKRTGVLALLIAGGLAMFHPAAAQAQGRDGYRGSYHNYDARRDRREDRGRVERFDARQDWRFRDNREFRGAYYGYAAPGYYTAPRYYAPRPVRPVFPCY